MEKGGGVEECSLPPKILGGGQNPNMGDPECLSRQNTFFLEFGGLFMLLQSSGARVRNRTATVNGTANTVA